MSCDLNCFYYLCFQVDYFIGASFKCDPKNCISNYYSICTNLHLYLGVLRVSWNVHLDVRKR